MNERIDPHEDETLEDLQRNGLRMIQKKKGFRYGEDSVFLAHFAAERSTAGSAYRQNPRIVDVGCGSGVVALLLSALLPHSTLTGVEADPIAADVARRNVLLNERSERLRIVEGDITSTEVLAGQVFDLMVCNPPYRVPGRGPAPAANHADAWEAKTLTPDHLAAAAQRLLRHKGVCVVIHAATSLPDLMDALRKNGVEPRSLRAIHPFADRPAKTVLLTAVKGGRPGSFQVLPPLIVRERDGAYTDDVRRWYAAEEGDGS